MKSLSKKMRLSLQISITLLLITGIYLGIRALTKPRVYIAVVTTQSDPLYEDEGISVINGAKLYVQEYNNSENDITIEIKEFDDKGDEARAIEIAKEIANDPKYVAVIGHLFSRTSLAAGKIYKENKIPVITSTASATDLKSNDWYFSIVPDNNSTGAFLASYTNRILKSENVTIVYDSSDQYSSTLKDGFMYPFKGLGGKVDKAYDLNNNNEVKVDTIVDDVLHNSEEAGLIFIATQKTQAKDLIIALRRKGIQNQILGGDTLGGTLFSQILSNEPEEQNQPGYFTDNIYASSPIIFDSAGKDAQEFFTAYKKEYKNLEPTWIAASSYDAAHVFVEAIKHSTSTSNMRQSIREYIDGLDTSSKAIKGGLSGDIYFDKQNDVVKPITVGVFLKGKFISAPTQYIPIPNIDLVSSLDQGVTVMNGQHVHEASIVYTGIEFNEISGLDEATSTYNMDFYIWFRYQGELDATNIQFLNAAEDISLGEALASNDDEINGHYRLYRVKGNFKTTFDFLKYPFDQQVLRVEFRHANLTRDNLVYVVDAVSISPTIDKDKNIFKSGSDWQIKENTNTPLFSPESVATTSSLGDPKLIGLNSETEYATFIVQIPISRKVLSFILRNLLPVFFTLILTYMSFFIPSDEFGTRTGILTGSILTIAFFHLGVSSNLRVGYTVALDYSFYAFYAIIMIGLSTTMVEWYLNIKWKKLEESIGETAKRSRKKAVVKETEAQIEQNKSFELSMLKAGKIFFPASLALLSLIYIVSFDLVTIPPLSFKNIAAQSSAPPSSTPVPESDKVTLTIGWWRVDDQTEIDDILAIFNGKKPNNIEVHFSPVVGKQYNDVLTLQLQGKNAPDLIFLSPAGGRVLNPQEIIANGYLEPLSTNDFPELITQYDQEALDTWADSSHQPYALPIFAVSHGIYYNEKIFNDLKLSPPKTWNELMRMAKKIQEKGYTPFANGFIESDPQRISDLLFTNMAPTFIGGPEGRARYEDGSLCFNSEDVINLFKAINDISKYMPENRETIDHNGTIELFASGKAAMYFGGSFDIKNIKKALEEEKEKATTENEQDVFTISVFAVPPPSGKRTYINYHIDSGIAINANSPHKKKALEFLKWMASPEFAQTSGEFILGFFPLNKQASLQLTDPLARDFYNLNAQYNNRTDIRWGLPNDGLPTGTETMQSAVFKMMHGEITPQEAANKLQTELALWYPPAQKCIP